MIHFLKEAKKEIKEVIWPSKKETMQIATIVSVITIIVSIMICALDFIFIKFITFVIRL